MRLLLLACLVACGSSKPIAEPDPTMPPPPPPVTTTTSPGIEMPVVPSTGFDRADQAAPQISVSPTALTVKGKVVITLADGLVGAADLQGGANGLIVTKLREHARELGAARVILKLDRRTSYLTLVQILSTLQLEGIGAVSILASSGPQLMSAPVELTPGPNRSGWVRHAVPGSGPSPRIQPVVALAATELTLFSISGTAGTKDKPALVMKANPGIDLVQLGSKLAELRKKHADAGDTVIVIAAADAMPLQTVLEVIATVRATADGKPLYPDILLASGRAP
jgi:biopolymer transport protein ExbD